jgi:hypothetical protein
MMQFTVDWDGQSLAWLVQFSNWRQEMDQLLWNLAGAFGDEGKTYIKERVKGNGKWQPSTGKTAAGIDYETEWNSDGWTIHFVGNNRTDDGKHNVAHMIDVGNFDENTELWAAGPGNGLGFKAFPISKRAGNVHTFLPVIRGMGASSPEYPKHFSDNAVYDLRDRANSIAERHLDEFLSRLV